METKNQLKKNQKINDQFQNQSKNFEISRILRENKNIQEILIPQTEEKIKKLISEQKIKNSLFLEKQIENNLSYINELKLQFQENNEFQTKINNNDIIFESDELNSKKDNQKKTFRNLKLQNENILNFKNERLMDKLTEKQINFKLNWYLNQSSRIEENPEIQSHLNFLSENEAIIFNDIYNWGRLPKNYNFQYRFFQKLPSKDMLIKTIFNNTIKSEIKNYRFYLFLIKFKKNQ